MSHTAFKGLLALGTGLFLASSAQAKTCKLEISGNDQMQYSAKTLTVEKDCTEVSLTLKHSGKLPKNVMGHNWILAKTSDVNDLAAAAMPLGLEKDYVPQGDKRVLAHTKVIGGGQSETITFKKAALTPGGDYTFFCSFPGHFAMMKGKFIVQ